MHEQQVEYFPPSNTLFSEKLSEVLKEYLKPLQARLDTLESNQLTEDNRHALEVVNESSLEDYDLQDDCHLQTDLSY